MALHVISPDLLLVVTLFVFQNRLLHAQSGLAACVESGHTQYPFCNTSLSLDSRVRDLVSRILPEDKPGLLTARAHKGLPYLGVPSYYWGSNCIHSSMFSNCTKDGKCSTSFPSGPSAAATFDTPLIMEMAKVIAIETRAGWNAKNWTDNGANGAGLDCWGPVININRDPRWGRNGEGGAEDPYLMGELALAWTQGMQNGEDPRYVLVAITLKHFVANAVEGMWTTNGTWSKLGTINRHTINALISKHDLADTYWPAFRKAIREGDAQGIMCSYNEVNGIPTCLDPLQRKAREVWGFSGYVTSDTDSIADAWQSHNYSSDAAEASCQAVSKGGCDIDSGNTFQQGLLDGVSRGNCSMDDINDRLYNAFRVRFRLGLFDPIDDQPYWKYNVDENMGTASSAALNLRAALESFVLLRNDKSILPLAAGVNIAVVGPHGNSTGRLIQADTGMICPSGKFDCVISPFAAITRENKAGQTTYTPGVGIISSNTSDIALAVEAAKASDVIIAAVGICNCGGRWHTTEFFCNDFQENAEFLEGETHDRENIDLPPAQKELLNVLLQLNKPMIVVLFNAGAVRLDLMADYTHDNIAIIEAFYPGAEGGVALSQAIFGRENYWGKMPYSIYKSGWEAAHNFLDHEVSQTGRTYRYGGTDILIPFGSGLSLTTFTLSSPSDALYFTTKGETNTTITVTVSNTGKLLAGDEVVQMYVIPKLVNGSIYNPLPSKYLIGFKRVADVGAGKSKHVSFIITARSFSLVNANGDQVVAPGTFLLLIQNGAGENIHIDVEITGPAVVIDPFPEI